jgi:ABC transport system ATP-binding/permease protein
MSQITLRGVSFRFRGPALFEEIDCEIQSGQRIGLLGRNGSGKSTLMKMLVGEVAPDSGQVVLAPGTRLARLVQDVPAGEDLSVLALVRQGGSQPNDSVDVADWEIEQRAEQLVSRMQLPADALFSSLSSGMKRRVLLAQALVQQPDVLLLDEPTNHLDVEAIQWLENFLARWPGTLIFVTHDRSFLQKLATRILELDRGRLFDWQCDYATFLERKEAALEAEEKQNALFDKRLAEEEVWIRQGIKARRTRNMGRVRALVEMRQQRQERRDRVGKVELQIDTGLRSGQLVIAMKQVSFRYGDKAIFEDFSSTIMRGEKVGIIGPNGAGKSTLLKVMLGKLAPTQGQVRLGTNLQIAYFDQLREQLDPEQTVQDNVGEGYDHLTIGGRSRHIIGYLSDFLFSAERARTQIKHLSGGERNRVLLAKLFAKPANLIVLDEPTNDLDLETLEILEARLVDYPGTVLMVSHDRTFLDNVVTSTIAFEADGVHEYDGGYADWQRQTAKKTGNNAKKPSGNAKSIEQKQTTSNQNSAQASQPNPSQTTTKAAVPTRKLKYTERVELEKLPGQIEALEARIAELQAETASPAFYQQPPAKIVSFNQDLAQQQEKLASLYSRWEELEQCSRSN